MHMALPSEVPNSGHGSACGLAAPIVVPYIVLPKSRLIASFLLLHLTLFAEAKLDATWSAAVQDVQQQPTLACQSQSSTQMAFQTFMRCSKCESARLHRNMFICAIAGCSLRKWQLCCQQLGKHRTRRHQAAADAAMQR